MDFKSDQYYYILESLLRDISLKHIDLDPATTQASSTNADNEDTEQLKTPLYKINEARYDVIGRLIDSKILLTSPEDNSLQVFTATSTRKSQHSVMLTSGRYDDSENDGSYAVIQSKPRLPVPSLKDIQSNLLMLITMHKPSKATTSSASSTLDSSIDAQLTTIILAQSIAALSVHISDKLIDDYYLISTTIQYWENQDQSSTTLFWYFLQTLPRRLATCGHQIVLNAWEKYYNNIALDRQGDGGNDSDKDIDILLANKSEITLFPQVLKDLQKSTKDTMLTAFSNNGNNGRSSKKPFVYINKHGNILNPLRLDNMKLLQKVRYEVRKSKRELMEMRNKVVYRIGQLTSATEPIGLNTIKGGQDINNDQDPLSLLLNIQQQIFSQKSELSVTAAATTTTASNNNNDNNNAEDIQTTINKLSILIDQISTTKPHFRLRHHHNYYQLGQLTDLGPHKIPPLTTRLWLPITAWILANLTISKFFKSLERSMAEISRDIFETTKNYVIRYIRDPLIEAYKIIRYGPQDNLKLVLDSSSSGNNTSGGGGDGENLALESDIKVLENMVLNFAAKYNQKTHDSLVNSATGAAAAAGGSSSSSNNNSSDWSNEILNRVRRGDLTDIMQHYTQEIQNPIRNVIFGDLVEAMLIQIQKVKVDAGLALSAMDKLLKANELNFLVLAILPAIGIGYFAMKGVYKVWKWLLVDSFDVKVVKQKKYAVREIQFGVWEISTLISTTKISSNNNEGDESTSNKDPVFRGNLLCLTKKLRQNVFILDPQDNTNTTTTTINGYNSASGIPLNVINSNSSDYTGSNCTGFVTLAPSVIFQFIKSMIFPLSGSRKKEINIGYCLLNDIRELESPHISVDQQNAILQRINSYMSPLMLLFSKSK
ncbi:Nuclear control of ATPase protein 2 [Mycoemilia scoparia]|uniref:Nuclear control of ATPase protein 2 n=1 Tax=Mycoemilia scoparia TaxID=417184 RepID=A0A9W7ZX73_9FUNG|nr:Nuclear control of ATPase protein 2 [Mycoemilia scoparia]